MTTGNNAEKIVEKIVEVEVPHLDNGQAAIMLLCGAVAGAFCLWAFFEYQKQQKNNAPVGVAVVEQDYPEIEDEEAIPQLRGQNGFSAFPQGAQGD